MLFAPTLQRPSARRSSAASIIASQRPANIFATQISTDAGSIRGRKDLASSGSASWEVVLPSPERPASLSRRASHGSYPGSPGAGISETWSSLPKHDSSIFFDDDESNENNASERDWQHGLPVQSPSASGSGAIRLSAEGEETDMLSLPSSLSMSDRSSFRSGPLSAQPSPKLGEVPAGPSLLSDGLTEAALSQIAKDGRTGGEADEDKALTPEMVRENDMDAYEYVLSHTPDAISAGIRPVRREPLQALQSHSASQRSDNALDKYVPLPDKENLSVRSSRRSSATKRRHRAAGISDKGSKRSNTSGSRADAGKAARSTFKSKGKAPAPESENYTRSARKPVFSLGQAARNILQIDDEMMEMLAQPGSVFR